MKRIALAALLSLGATLAGAQAVEAPKLKCEPKPEYPGKLASDTQKRSFDKQYKAYDVCVKAYVEERKASIKAHGDAAQAAVDEYNTLVNKIRADAGQPTDADTKDKATPPAGAGGSKKY